MPDRPDDLPTFRRLVLDGLSRAANDRNSTFRMPVLCTVAADGRPEGRTMVVRSFDAGEPSLDLYTDIRSPKCDAIAANDTALAVFWDKGRHLQLRVRGRIVVHHDNETAATALDDIPKDNRDDYARDLAPGAPRETPKADIDHARAPRYFALLRLVIEEVDALHLGREAHRRALFTFGTETNGAQWLTP